MIKEVKANLYLLFKKKEYWLTFFSMLIFCCYTNVNEVMKNTGKDLFNIGRASDHFVLNYWLSYCDTYTIFFPILLGVMVGFPTFDENRNKNLVFSVARTTKKKMFFSKWIVSFLSGASVAFVPLMVNIILNEISFYKAVHHYYGMEKSSMAFCNQRDVLEFLYSQNELMYEIGYVVLVSVFAGACCMFVFSVCHFIRKFKIFTVLPLYVLFFVSNSLHISRFNLNDYLLCPLKKENLEGMLIVTGIMIVGSGVIVKKISERMELK
jgi:hypothetical protein